MRPLNTWCATALVRAARLVEDIDRKSFTSNLVLQTIGRLESLATTSAYATPEPKISRYQNEDGVAFEIEWHDMESGWFLCVSVRRQHGAKPRTSLEFSGNPKSYFSDNPTDEDIRPAMHDYLQERKK
jgi:hypothetical protein